jgi:CO/xanthine dehydrogenase FAD-binding subunit
MAISIASVAVIADRAKRNVRVGLGAVGPVPLRAREAEAFAAENIDWAAGQALDPQVHARFGSLVAEASHPIDDHRSSLAYRRHAVGVLATRALRRMFP